MQFCSIAARALNLASVLALCACAPMQQLAPADGGRTATAVNANRDTIAPNANLVVQGIAPIPGSVADTVARYNDFRGHAFVDWHPTKREMLVAYRDPRVPYTEGEQIVARVRANGTPVWYLRAENEGHGFARKENADFQFYAMVMFIRETLLK